ncbi:hypothetical protein CsatB_001907 [Cannabis sativa]
MDKDMIHSLTSIFNGIEESDDNDIMGLPTPSMDEEYLTQYNQCVLDQHFKIYYEDENENIIKVGGRLSDKNFEQELYTPKLSDYLPKQNQIEKRYVDVEAKLESTKRKLHNNYQKIEQKKHKSIKLSEVNDFSKKIKVPESNKAREHLCDKRSQAIEPNTQKFLDHLPKNKPEKQQSINLEAKLESTKQKLHDSYQKIEKKKHQSILLSEVKDYSKKIEVPKIIRSSLQVKQKTLKLPDYVPKQDKSEKQSVEDETKLESTKRKQMEQMKPIICMKQQNIDLETKLEFTKQKLHNSYQKIEQKKHKIIKLLEVKDLPRITETKRRCSWHRR